MGPALGRLRILFRPVKNFNVEERAFKEIGKDKASPAPTHHKMQALMDEIRQDPELLTRGKLDPRTMENLSQVFIKSTGHNPVIVPSKKLPQQRKGYEGYEYGFEEPAKIPKGKASMRQILEILNSYETKPRENTPEKLAQDYNLELQDVKNLLKYFKPFQVYIPKKDEKKPRLGAIKLLQQKMDQLKE